MGKNEEDVEAEEGVVDVVAVFKVPPIAKYKMVVVVRVIVVIVLAVLAMMMMIPNHKRIILATNSRMVVCNFFWTICTIISYKVAVVCYSYFLNPNEILAGLRTTL